MSGSDGGLGGRRRFEDFLEMNWKDIIKSRHRRMPGK